MSDLRKREFPVVPVRLQAAGRYIQKSANVVTGKPLIFILILQAKSFHLFGKHFKTLFHLLKGFLFDGCYFHCFIFLSYTRIYLLISKLLKSSSLESSLSNRFRITFARSCAPVICRVNSLKNSVPAILVIMCPACVSFLLFMGFPLSALATSSNSSIVVPLSKLSGCSFPLEVVSKRIVSSPICT
ncbi:hypothetical protein EZS27_029504 [termite gut metagenome]|uniref:Uncharacterized protein n=1 Tax=termite gut metagenome TaxID=433724 RepID=A0A5J4QIH8_9ZZZZ